MIEKRGCATLVDVARKAGVSLKTASRVLNDSPELRPETAARVREAMAQLGYQPNEMARGLKSKRSAAITLIAPNLADPFTAAAVQAAQDVAREHGYVVILATSGGDVAVEESELQVMSRRQIDGVILVAANSSKSNLKPLLAKNLPIVVFDEPVRGEEVDTITVTNRKGARGATEHLIEHGYRRILAVGARPALYTCAERVAGYRSAMKKAKLEPRELLVKHEDELTPESFAEFVKGPNRVDAIFSLNWVCSMKVLRAMDRLRKRFPKDLAFVSFDDFELAEMIPPGLTVVRQPSSELGRKAATVLFERMEGTEEHSPRNIVLDTQFIIRGSCGCKPTTRS